MYEYEMIPVTAWPLFLEGLWLRGPPWGRPLGSSAADGADGHEPTVTGGLPGRLARRGAAGNAIGVFQPGSFPWEIPIDLGEF